MFKNHLRIAFRNLIKNRFFSSLNILGLSVGLAVSLALMLFVKEELSFDRYHEKAADIYRLGIDVEYEDTDEKWASVPNIAGPAFTDEIAEVQSYVRFLRHRFGQSAFLNVDGQNFLEKDFYWVDSTVFSVFDVPLLAGDPATALAGPNKVVLSEETAFKIFGNLNPMGQTIKLDNNREMLVTGVFAEFPDNSTLDCKIMASFMTQEWASKNLFWSNCSFETYVLLHPTAELKEVEAEMAAVLDRNVKKEEQWFSFWGQPLTDVHLHSQGISSGYSSRIGDVRQVKLLSILALAVLLLACFNYVNMTTARSQQRFREVGINKTLGASTAQMIRRFYVETGVLVGLSLLVGVFLVEVSLPLFESIAGKEMSVFDLLNTKWVWALPAIWLVTTLGAGMYPALFLSSFTPKKLLAPVQTGITSSKFFRKTLVISQFTVCVALIIGALVFNQQLHFIGNKNLGFQAEQVLAITTAGAENAAQINALNNELASLPAVQKVARMQAFPGMEASGYSMVQPGNSDRVVGVSSNWVEPGFEEVLNLNFLAGKTLPAKTKEDTTVQVVMNEAGVAFLGYTPEEAIGKSPPQLYGDRLTTIVGVVEDFHFESLHSPIMPYVFTNGNDMSWNTYSLVRLETNDLKNTMQQLESVFSKHVPTSAFEYTFLDDHLGRLYSGEKKLSKVVLVFTLLTIFISCLGLFGLAAFTAERRTKEIGIRKVLGATVPGLVGILARDFLKPVSVAIFIAVPLSWFGMNAWLEDFAYRIDIAWWIFALAGVAAILVAFFTVSVQSFKAALANPVDSLKTE
ncbi:MAG: ABC transporter permease [Bacteroidota bacterium]